MESSSLRHHGTGIKGAWQLNQSQQPSNHYTVRHTYVYIFMHYDIVVLRVCILLPPTPTEMTSALLPP